MELEPEGGPPGQVLGVRALPVWVAPVLALLVCVPALRALPVWVPALQVPLVWLHAELALPVWVLLLKSLSTLEKQEWDWQRGGWPRHAIPHLGVPVPDEHLQQGR